MKNTNAEVTLKMFVNHIHAWYVHFKAGIMIPNVYQWVHVHKSIQILGREDQGCCCFFLIIKNFLNQQTGPDGVQDMHLLKSKIKVQKC